MLQTARLHSKALFTAHILPCCSVLQAVRRLLENCCSDDVTLNVVEHGYHELFLGPEKEQVTHTLSDWLLSIAEKAKSRRQAGQMWHQHRTVS